MKIGIIAAMKEELNAIQANLSGVKKLQFGQLICYKGMLFGHEVLLMLCGIGKVNATIGCTMLIEKHNPDYIINTGVAGGFSSALKIGDIVVSTELRHHDADATIFDYAYGQIPQMPVAFFPDSDLISKVLEISTKFKSSRVVSGAIMSGDSFVHKIEHIKEIKSKFPGIIACEMEGAAIAQTCHIFTTKYIIVRSISDLVFRERSNETYRDDMKQAAENSTKLVNEIIKHIEV